MINTGLQMLRKSSIGTQVLVLCGSVMVLLTFGLTWINNHRQTTEFQEVFSKQAKALAFNLAVSSANPILEKDLEVLEILLLKTTQFESLKSAAVVSREGRVYSVVSRDPKTHSLKADYDIDRIALTTTPQQAKESRQLKNANTLTVIEPVEAGDVIGYVVLDFDLSPIAKKIQEHVIENILLATLLIIPALLGLWLFIGLTRRQLQGITAFAENLVKEEATQPGKRPSSSELLQLHETLNWASATLKERNEALVEATRKADKSNELKSQFVANMSHEIRTPLNGILGLTEVTLGQNQLGDQSRKNLILIQSSAEHLLRVVNDILDFSKIDADRLDIEAHPFNLRKTIGGLIKTIGNAYAKPTVELIFNIDEQVPNMLLGDSARLTQVLGNLLSNALKFTQKGSVILQIRQSEPATANTAKLQFSVRDTGVGISDTYRSVIFKAFSQAEPGTARKYGGTGLGLTISQRLLELMGSSMELWSKEGAGSEFSFSLQLPVLSIEEIETMTRASDDDDDDATALKNIDKPTLPELAPPVHVLVAEDNMVNQTFIAHVLTQLGVSFRFADDGLQAIQLCEDEKFNLVFMDMHMPNMGGLEACKIILGKQKNAHLPIVGLTADAISDTRDACMVAGMRDYISKPFKKTDLEEVFKKLNFKICPVPLQNFDHDRDLFKSSCATLAHEIPDLITGLQTARHAGDYEQVRRIVHTVKDHCKLLGELEFANLLQTLENDFNDELEPKEALLQHLYKNLQVMQARVHQLSL